jgi:Putative metallopeptidase
MVHRMKVVTFALILSCAPQGAGWAAAPKDLRPNRIEILYVQPTNPAHQHIYEVLRQRHVLERFKSYLSPLRLPRTLFLKTAGCDGEVNAWYEASDHAVTVCYEYIDEVLRDAPDVATTAGVTSEDAIVGPTVEVFLHEIGHAIFHLLKVPIMGREEDAADEFAAYEMVHLDNDLTRQTVDGVAFMYWHETLSQDPKLKHFSDVHSVPAQRYYNLLCLAYGEDPKQFADLVEKKYLPESRAQGCVDEYRQLDYAIRKLIYPYFDQVQLKNVQRKKLLKLTPG